MDTDVSTTGQVVLAPSLSAGRDISTLRASGGNFTTATLACSGNDLAATFLGAPELPAAGQATWYIVRGENCGGHGTYDSGAPSQVGSRDAGINASAQSCP